MTSLLALGLILAAAPRCVEVLALADLHGHLSALPEAAARVEALRGRGPVLLLDAGDSLQGTLEAARGQGAAVVEAYGELGLAAAAVGNHDFDHGAEALRARMGEARYPFLSANLTEKATGAPPAWKGLARRHLVRLPGGLTVGLLGLSGRDTPYTTMPRNVAGLAFGDPLAAATREAAALRAEGAALVVAIAHVGGRCRERTPGIACPAEGELRRLAEGLPPGAVDAIVGGHTHELVAERIGSTGVVQPGAHGAFLGWITLCEGRAPEVHPPVALRPGEPFLGEVRRPPPKVVALVERHRQEVRRESEEAVGAVLPRKLGRSRTAPSTLGAATAQSLRAAAGADFGLLNPGSLRADLPAGRLTRGKLHEALPFDDRVAVLELTGAELAALVGRLQGSGKGFPQVAGLLLGAEGPRRCGGEPLEPGRRYRVATSEFVATGGDQRRRGIRQEQVSLLDGTGLRQALADWLQRAPPERLAAQCP